MSELALTKELNGIEKSKAEQIRAVFQPMADMLDQFEAAYSEVMDMEQSEEKSARAKRLRLDIAKIRIEADKRRKEIKEEYLRAGKAIDGTANILKWAVTEKEDQLKEVELYYQRIEENRLKKLQEDREAELAQYDFDGSSMDLSGMDEAVWNNFLTGTRSNWEAIKEAERKAEQERAEQERKEKIYNHRYRELAKYSQFGALELLTDATTEKEYATLYSEMKAKQSEYDKEQKRIREENARLQRESQEREEKARAAEEQAKKEREEREAYEKKVAAEKAEEERKKAEEEKQKAEDARRAAMAPDRDKLLSYATDILSKLNSVESKDAKNAIQKASYVLTSAAEQM